MPPSGRLDLHIVARFLDRLTAAGSPGHTRSSLQRAVGLNYDLFCKYLDALTERGLVAVEGTAVTVTDEGRRIHRELVSWLERLFGGRL